MPAVNSPTQVVAYQMAKGKTETKVGKFLEDKVKE